MPWWFHSLLWWWPVVMGAVNRALCYVCGGLRCAAASPPVLLFGAPPEQPPGLVVQEKQSYIAQGREVPSTRNRRRSCCMCAVTHECPCLRCAAQERDVAGWGGGLVSQRDPQQAATGGTASPGRGRPPIARSTRRRLAVPDGAVRNVDRLVVVVVSGGLRLDEPVELVRLSRA